MNWRVEATIIDEWVPAPREAFHVVNEFGDVAYDSLTEDYAAAAADADVLNSEEIEESVQWIRKGAGKA